MENITFNFGTVIGLLSFSFGLCVYIFNRAVSDIDKNIKDLKEWQIKQDKRLNDLEKVIEKGQFCFDYIKKDLQEIKKELKK